MTGTDGCGTPRPADSKVRFDGPDGFDDDVAIEEDVGIERLFIEHLFCVDAATLRCLRGR
jgi:hypothetical protein